jgi:hypothetical protein
MLIVAIVLLSNVRSLKSTATFDFTFIGNDEISLYEKRFEGLRKALPSHGVVSYTDDCGKASEEVFKAYYLAQYALSPVVLFYPQLTNFYSQKMLAQKGQFVIENFHDPSLEPYLTRLLPALFGVNGSQNSGAHQQISTSVNGSQNSGAHQQISTSVNGSQNSGAHQQISKNEGLTLVEDFGNGIKLYRCDAPLDPVNSDKQITKTQSFRRFVFGPSENLQESLDGIGIVH